MNYNRLTSKHKNNLQEIVSKDRFSTGESNLNLHSKDQSHHPPSMPEAVIWPVDRFEVSEILKYANKNLIPITGWGSGSSLEGNPIPVRGGIVLDFSQMNRIVDIREKDFQADVEPGVIYQDLNERLKYSGLFFPTDPVGGLPVKKGKFKDLCKPTTEGGPGYKNFLCWDSALAMEIPIPGLEGTVFDGITKVRTLFAILWQLAFVCVIPPPGAMWEGFVELSKNELHPLFIEKLFI